MVRKGWYSRGYIGHADVADVAQFLTWRLADSLPAQILEEWRTDLRREPSPVRKREWQRRIEKYLDVGNGSMLLKNPVAARLVQSKLIEFHTDLYTLHAWVVMPTHVHALLTPTSHNSLAQIIQRIKGGSSFEIGKRISFEKPLWEPDYFDRFIRNEEHFERVLSYIEWNPVKAKLCSDPARWLFSSANPQMWTAMEDRERGFCGRQSSHGTG